MPAYVFNAKPEEVSDTVIMPGDPLRAKYISDNLLYTSDLDADLIFPTSNILGYVPDENYTDGVAENGIPIGYENPLLHGGQMGGSASLSQSSVFDFFLFRR